MRTYSKLRTLLKYTLLSEVRTQLGLNKAKAALSLAYMVVLSLLVTRYAFLPLLARSNRLLASNTVNFQTLLNFRLIVVFGITFLFLIGNLLKYSSEKGKKELLSTLPISNLSAIVANHIESITLAGFCSPFLVFYIYSAYPSPAFLPFSLLFTIQVCVMSATLSALALSRLKPKVLGKLRNLGMLLSLMTGALFVIILHCESHIIVNYSDTFNGIAKYTLISQMPEVVLYLIEHQLVEAIIAEIYFAGFLGLMIVVTWKALKGRGLMREWRGKIVVKKYPWNLDRNPLLKWLRPSLRGFVIKEIRYQLRHTQYILLNVFYILLFSAILLSFSKVNAKLEDLEAIALVLSRYFFIFLLSGILSGTIAVSCLGIEGKGVQFVISLFCQNRLFAVKLTMNFLAISAGTLATILLTKTMAIAMKWPFQHVEGLLLSGLFSSVLFSLLAIGSGFKYPDFKRGDILLIGRLRFFVLSGICTIVGMFCIALMIFTENMGVKLISLIVIGTILAFLYHRAKGAVRQAFSLDY